MQDGLRRDPFAAKDVEEVIPGVPSVDDERKVVRVGEAHLLSEGHPLHRSWTVLVVVVEPSFADTSDVGTVPVEECLDRCRPRRCLVGVETNDSSDEWSFCTESTSGSLCREVDGLFRGLSVSSNHHERSSSRLASTGEECSDAGIVVAIALLEVAVRVDPDHG